MPRHSRDTLATVRRLALALPGVEEGLSYPEAFFVTEHYRGRAT